MFPSAVEVDHCYLEDTLSESYFRYRNIENGRANCKITSAAFSKQWTFAAHIDTLPNRIG